MVPVLGCQYIIKAIFLGLSFSTSNSFHLTGSEVSFSLCCAPLITTFHFIIIMQPITLLFAMLFLVQAFIITPGAWAAKKSDTWSFKNWNKYKSNEMAWRKKWGIDESSGWAWPHDNDGNHKIVADPSSKKTSVLRVEYPKGSSNPQSNPQGGIGFYAEPFHLKKEAKQVVLEYQVYFPKRFTFVQGGKLPGLYGGHEGCSGGADADSCFSTR